ncbi:ATP-binding protein [Streptantibioticus parmotrematis]|nr:ATP-binding protein [Streptantibioticus parmotrematis]
MKTGQKQLAPYVWEMEFAPHARCVFLVRRRVERALVRWGLGDEDDIGVVVLVCSELATNAVEHAQRPFRVRVTADDAGCLVEVSDADPAPPRFGETARADAERGRGLLLVAALSHATGHRPEPDGGKTVWARIGWGCGT